MYGSLHRSDIHLQCLFSFLKYKEKSDVCKHVLLKYLFWYWPPISSLTFFFTVLHFYWRSHFAVKGSAGEATQLGFHPYIPQCDGLGNWEPTQCYESTGEQSPEKYSTLSERRKSNNYYCFFLYLF